MGFVIDNIPRESLPTAKLATAFRRKAADRPARNYLRPVRSIPYALARNMAGENVAVGTLVPSGVLCLFDRG